MFYSVFSKENDELVDLLELTDSQKSSFCKANPNLYLEIHSDDSENPLDAFDPLLDTEDFYD